MKVIIIGAGEKGYHTAKVLTAEKHDVVVIDRSPVALQRVEEHFDLLAIQGLGSSPPLLREAGIAEADLLIAVTNNDEVNMLACLQAAKHGVPTKVARVSTPDYFGEESDLDPSDVGIDLLINPEMLSAKEFYRLLHTPEAREIVDFAQGRVRLIAFQTPKNSILCNRPLKELRNEDFQAQVLFAAIKRTDGKTVIPSGKDIIHDGDEVFAVGTSDMIRDLLRACGIEERRLTRVIIAGADRIGIYLAQMLEEDGVHVTIIDPDLDKAEAASSILRRTTVLHGDYLEDDVLDEAGVQGVDGFVSATGEDETDIMASVAAKQRGAIRVLALVQKPRNLPLLTAMPTLDGAVSRHLAAVSHILRLIRRGEIVSVASLHEINAEVLELVAGPGSAITKKALSAVRFPKNALVGAIVRGDEVIVPSGRDHVESGDRVVVFALPESIPEVEKLFVGR